MVADAFCEPDVAAVTLKYQLPNVASHCIGWFGSPATYEFAVTAVNTLSAGVVLPSGVIKAANTVGAELLLESIRDTNILSCILAPILKPCSLYGGLVACDVYP